MISRKCVMMILVFMRCFEEIPTISIGVNANGTSTEKLEERNIIDSHSHNEKYKDNIYSHYNILHGNYRYPNMYNKYTSPHSYRPIGENMYFRPPENSIFDQNQNVNIKTTVLDILYSIARNDDLHCVPKILCEMTSGRIYGRQKGFNIPLNIDAGTLLGLLSSVNGLEESPLFYFSKAALLGYSSKGNTRFCATAYPHCPTNPDKLIQYLNNHNGGFFRYFSHINSNNMDSYEHPDLPQYHNQLYFDRDHRTISANRRIQNKPTIHIENNLEGSIKFPDNELKYKIPEDTLTYNSDKFFSFERPYKSLKFPSNINEISNSEIHRNPKAISNFYANKNLIRFERPSSHHKVSEMFFPDRTGTGELIIDSTEFDKTNIAYEDDDIRIKYKS